MATIENPESNLLIFSGEIDLSQSPAIREAFQNVAAAEPQVVFVDLSGVSYIDSSGLACLIEAMQKLKKHGGKLVLFGLRDTVRSIFEISRLDMVFSIYPDREAAEAALA